MTAGASGDQEDQQVFGLVIVAAVLVAAVGAGLGVATAKQTLDPRTVSRQIALDVLNRSRQTVSVQCPSGEEKKKGHTFQCTGTDARGASAVLLVTVIDDDGTVRWEVAPGPAASAVGGATDPLTESALRAAQLAEEQYFEGHHTYTTSLAELAALSFTVPEEIDLRVARADDHGYCLQAKGRAAGRQYTLSNDGGEPVPDSAC